MIEYRFESDTQRTAAYDDGSIVGICQYQIRGNQCLIVHTETAPSYQGQGIARKLVLLCADEMSKAGYEIVPVCSYAVHVLG